MSLSRPKTPKSAYVPPPPVTVETIDEAALAEQQRERQRARARSGRQSTIVAGNVQPTTQTKTLLGQ